ENAAFECGVANRRRCSLLGGCHGLFRGWNANFAHGSAFRPIARNDVAAVFFEYSVTDTQAEPGAFANTLGGIKRVEDSLGIGYTGAAVVELRVDEFVLAVHLHLEGSARALFDHGIGSVIDDVEVHLLDLVRIGIGIGSR